MQLRAANDIEAVGAGRSCARRLTAIVSGSGPNGVLAALTLLREGFEVTLVEQRPSACRNIHLGVRESYLRALAEVAPDLARAVTKLLSPIVGRPQSRQSAFASGKMHARLDAPVVALARVDELETAFRRYLDSIADGKRLHLHRETRLDVVPDGDRYSAQVGPSPYAPTCAPSKTLPSPDLLVIAEGGKSVNADRLGLHADKYSAPKRYLSGHTDAAIGPRQIRLDTYAPTVQPTLAPLVAGVRAALAPVSYWATGHIDPQKGTWVVLEVPDGVDLGPTVEAQRYFTHGARELFRANDRDSSQVNGYTPEFVGVFSFAQQMRSGFTAGSNVVLFGDAAGMGHHALSSGIEVGCSDAEQLRRLAKNLKNGFAPRIALAVYADAIRTSRLELIEHGMAEYTRKPSTASADNNMRAQEKA